MGWIVGADVGGTFTDIFALREEDGHVALHKTPSTPDNPADAIVQGCSELRSREGFNGEEFAKLCHGTTVATNALIQGRGGKLALVVTKGFRDLLEIGRQVRPKLYDFQEDFPPPLVPRERRFELSERLTSTGDVLIQPSDEEIGEVVRTIIDSGAEACAICFLFSFMNGVHEQRMADALRRAAPQLYVSISSDVQPEFREYERLLTTSLNAYLQPVMSNYLTTIENEFAETAPMAPIGVNQSSGGLMSLARARMLPIRTALSGPAAGIMGALRTARFAERPNIITLDMGGTSADVSLIRDYGVGITFERDLEGYPIRLPSIDINAVGAGGGSIAWFERDGLLKVGPDSSGAVPGPACYGRGGTQPTVSDANLVLGRLSKRGLLGGGMALDDDAARKVIQPIADKVGLTVEKAAQGIIKIVVSNMVRAIRGISVEKGIDPRNHTLLAFGGAGPLHATEVARQLGITKILIPPAPGILCAQGLVFSDLKETFVQTTRIKVEEGAKNEIDRQLGLLVRQAADWFASEGIFEGSRRMEAVLDMRYIGQNFELPVILSDGETTVNNIEALRQSFFDIHELNYGYSSVHDAVEIINVRLTASGPFGDAEPVQNDSFLAKCSGSVDRRDVFFQAENPIATMVYERAQLSPDDVIEGPAIIEQMDATTVVFPNDTASIDSALNILIEVNS